MVKPRIVETSTGIDISDLRRDMNPVIKYFMKESTKSTELVSGLISSINASYTKRETEDLFVNTDLKVYKITTNPFSIFVKGVK